MDNDKKLQRIVFKISFLLPHQEVNPDIKDEIERLIVLNRTNDAYLSGAHDALQLLFLFLKTKGYTTS